MKTKSRYLAILCIFEIILVSQLASAGLLYSYHDLALKDLDQMNKIVTDKIKESKKSGSGQSVPLKEALQAVYSRPNDDAIIEKVSGPLKTQLTDLGAYEKTVESLTAEALNALKNSKNFKPSVQVTYAYFLENLMAQTKLAAREEGFEKSMIEKIAKSDVALSKEAINERKLRLMKESKSPSEIARDILEKLKDVSPAPTASPSISTETSDGDKAASKSDELLKDDKK